jgi:alginate O-acetyltransferase complex protein AlgI
VPFHSPAFFFLCLLTFALYYGRSERWQHGVLLASSLAFYYYAGLVDTVLLLSVVSANHLVARWTSRADGRRALVSAIVINLGVLAFFKYRRFVLETINRIAGTHLPLPELTIPLGISFYIFQLIAYQVDVSRGVLPVERSFGRMLLYILFFPHHQAGPIMRPAKFLPQFHGRKLFDARLVATGGLWILWGLAKKVVADNVASVVEPGFADPSSLGSAADAWRTAVLYAAQIYLDFSGYSDIALGLGRLFGYELDRNFDQPYLAGSPSELWTRWHVTLSAWLRDYVYIPLGGNRRGEARTYLNLMLTMLLGGLWHGASVMFLLWGAIHGALLVLSRLFPAPFRVRGLGWLLTFVATVLAWVPFRAATFGGCAAFLGVMFGARGAGGASAWRGALMVAAALLLSQLVEDLVLHTGERRRRAEGLWLRVPDVARGAVLAASIALVVLGLADHTTYIYFRF